MPTEEQRRTRFMKRVDELVESGRHKDYLTIESALSAEYPEARAWLEGDSLRADIKQACDRAIVRGKS